VRIVLLNCDVMPNPDYDNMASGLRQRGHTVWLASRDLDGNLQWHDGNQVIAVHPGPIPLSQWQSRLPIFTPLLRRLRFLPIIRHIRRFLRQLDPDIVQIHPPGFHLVTLLPLWMPGRMHFVLDIRQFVSTTPGTRAGWLKKTRKTWAWRLESRFLYDHSCFNDGRTARKLLGERWVQWATAVPVGIHPRFLTTHRPALPRPVTGQPIRFLYVGALTKFRELDLLFLAARQVLSTTADFEMLFVGPDAASGHYHHLVVDLGLEGIVTLQPAIPYDEMPELMARCDVGLAYVPERLPWQLQPTIKVLEYRASGMPILSTAVEGHRGLVQDGVNGLFLRNTVEEWSRGLLKLIMDPAFLAQCHENAQGMRSAFTIADAALAYEQQVYDRLLSASVVQERSVVKPTAGHS
jgi:glycosyltransferase involved in cell wall biosynthesis